MGRPAAGERRCEDPDAQAVGVLSDLLPVPDAARCMPASADQRARNWRKGCFKAGVPAVEPAVGDREQLPVLPEPPRQMPSVELALPFPPPRCRSSSNRRCRLSRRQVWQAPTRCCALVAPNSISAPAVPALIGPRRCRRFRPRRCCVTGTAADGDAGNGCRPTVISKPPGRDLRGNRIGSGPPLRKALHSCPACSSSTKFGRAKSRTCC